MKDLLWKMQELTFKLMTMFIIIDGILGTAIMLVTKNGALGCLIAIILMSVHGLAKIFFDAEFTREYDK